MTKKPTHKKRRRSSVNSSSGEEALAFLFLGLIFTFWNDLKAGKAWAIITTIVIVLGAGFLAYFFIIKKYLIKKPLPSVTMKEIDKMTGNEFEYFVSDLFKAMGYQTEVTQASHDYGADVIAKRNEVKIVIQVKHYKNAVGFRSIEEVNAGKVKYKADEAYIVTNSESFTSQCKKEAKTFRIHLIDRKDLQELIDKYLPPQEEQKDFQIND